MNVRNLFLTIPSSEMWQKMQALRIFYSFVYFVFSEHPVAGTIVGIADKAVNKTEPVLSLHTSTGDMVFK